MELKKFSKQTKERLDKLNLHKRNIFFMECVKIILDNYELFTEPELNQFLLELDLVIAANRSVF